MSGNMLRQDGVYYVKEKEQSGNAATAQDMALSSVQPGKTVARDATRSPSSSRYLLAKVLHRPNGLLRFRGGIPR